MAGLVDDTAVYAVRFRARAQAARVVLCRSGNFVRGTAGSAFNGIIATVHRGQVPGLTGAVANYVDWGDGTPINAPPIFLNPIGHGAFQIRSVLGSPGRKTFSFCRKVPDRSRARSAFGKSVILHRTAIMAPAPLNVAGGDVTAVAGMRSTMTVAAFTDSGTALPAGAYSAKIDWGGGKVSDGTITANRRLRAFL